MKKETAIQIINEAINIAIAKGCFGLVEVTNIVKAIEFLQAQPDIEFGEITEHQELKQIRETPLG
jgi:hypothetical protein